MTLTVAIVHVSVLPRRVQGTLLNLMQETSLRQLQYFSVSGLDVSRTFVPREEPGLTKQLLTFRLSQEPSRGSRHHVNHVTILVHDTMNGSSS